MARSNASFSKREKEKKRLQKREEKQQRKEERKAGGGGGLDSMIAYVDENGMIVDTPPDPAKREEVNAEDIELGVPKREEVVPERRTGKIDFFDTSRGFGFIKETGGPQDRFFVHVSELDAPVQDGDAVTFDVERGPRGMNAVRVTKA
ncbi:MAG: cold shock domain-containing protein [Flavobacteriales bacterium]|jgi:cold shock CspA family protein|nr:cold shock domain-containing protein [Flavobacteriales bacterium]